MGKKRKPKAAPPTIVYMPAPAAAAPAVAPVAPPTPEQKTLQATQQVANDIAGSTVVGKTVSPGTEDPKRSSRRRGRMSTLLSELGGGVERFGD